MSPRNTKDSNRRGSKKVASGPDCSDDDAYRVRRQRNNDAVKKSRIKSKMRTQQTLEKVHKLKTENKMLEEKINILTKELEFLKELFFAHTGKSNESGIDPAQIDMLLQAASQEDKVESNSTRRPRNFSIEERKDRF